MAVVLKQSSLYSIILKCSRHSMVYFEWNLHTQISGAEYSCVHYFKKKNSNHISTAYKDETVCSVSLSGEQIHCLRQGYFVHPSSS